MASPTSAARIREHQERTPFVACKGRDVSDPATEPPQGYGAFREGDLPEMCVKQLLREKQRAAPAAKSRPGAVLGAFPFWRTHMPRGYLSLRLNLNNERHHLWLNNGTWWANYTLHWGFRKKRVRKSLKTSSLEVAIERRDLLLEHIALHGEEVSEGAAKRRSLEGDDMGEASGTTDLHLVA